VINIKDINECRKAVKKAKSVFIQPRFGASERWVKVSKVEALDLLQDISGSPEENEMYAGLFGSLSRHGELYLG
jgi:hypothetical protein